jgi:hypothetical protein
MLGRLTAVPASTMRTLSMNTPKIISLIADFKNQLRLVILIAVAVMLVLQFTVLPGTIDFITTIVVFGLGVAFSKLKRL